MQVLRDRELVSAASAGIRMAQLSIDSDQAVEMDLLISAAKDAIFLSNLPLGERIARAAFERDGGLQAGELLSRALLWQGHPVQADEILTRFDPNGLDELQLLLWGLPRVSILFWSMGDVVRAHEVLSLMRAGVEHPSLKLVVDAIASAMAVHENKIEEGIAAAEAVLADSHAPNQAIEFAAFSAGLAMPTAGRGDDFEPIAARCRAEQTRHRRHDPGDGAVLRCARPDAHRQAGPCRQAGSRVRQLLLGRTVHCVGDRQNRDRAGRHLSRELPRGHLVDRTSSCGGSAEAPLPWQLPARLLLARAYAALGRKDDAERVLTEAAAHTGPSMELHEPQRTISKAWLAAAKGMERRAVELALWLPTMHMTQDSTPSKPRPCTTRPGSATAPSRIDLPHLRIRSRVASSRCRLGTPRRVAAADPAALDASSAELEEAGFLLSAADSAAVAATLHDSAGDRRKSMESSARALRLADQCGGAATPAIKAAARPLPVTAREREIAELIAAGLTNKEIAEQLTLSIRTVEGHVYRACFKLDVADRDELAKLIRQEPPKEPPKNGQH